MTAVSWGPRGKGGHPDACWLVLCLQLGRSAQLVQVSSVVLAMQLAVQRCNILNTCVSLILQETKCIQYSCTPSVHLDVVLVCCNTEHMHRRNLLDEYCIDESPASKCSVTPAGVAPRVGDLHVQTCPMWCTLHPKHAADRACSADTPMLTPSSICIERCALTHALHH